MEAAMGAVVIPHVLEEKLGRAASEALIGLVNEVVREEKSDVLGRIDEKVSGRYEEIRRHSHEDVAGVELRLTNRFNDVETRMGQLEVRLGNRIQEVELKLGKQIQEYKIDVIRWIVAMVVVQAGLMVVVAWAAKHMM
jgi:hypothetical protein